MCPGATAGWWSGRPSRSRASTTTVTRRGRPRPAAGGPGAAARRGRAGADRDGGRPAARVARQRPHARTGHRGPEGLVVATGHYRNGILLTPVTADAVAELPANGQVLELIARFGRTVRRRGGRGRTNGRCRDRDRQRPAGPGRSRPDRGRAATARARPPCRRPGHRRRPQRRGGPPQRPGPPPAWTRAIRLEVLGASQEVEHRWMDPFVIAGQAFSSPRLISGDRRGGQPGGAGAGPLAASGTEPDHRGPAPHQPAGRGVDPGRPAAGRVPAAPTPPAASPPATPCARPGWPGRRSTPTGSSSR